MKYLLLTLLLLIGSAKAQPLIDPYRFSCFTCSPLTLITNIVAYYRLEEASGDRADSSGNGNTLNDLAGTVGNAPGKICLAGSFATNALQHADSDLFRVGSTNYTFTAWVKPNGLNVDQYIMCKGSQSVDEYGLSITSTNSVFFWYLNTSSAYQTVKTTNVISDTNWHFIVARRDAGANTLSVTIDEGGTTTSSTTLHAQTTTARFNMGAYRLANQPVPDVTQYQFYGLIDEFGFWKRVLSTTESASLYTPYRFCQ